jgi:hypothetical protein
MINTITKLVFNDEDLLEMTIKAFKGNGYKEDREHTTFMKMVFKDCITDFGFKKPKQYPCLAKLTICQVNGNIDVNWKWYYYNDIMFWEIKMNQYKMAMTRKIKVLENSDFIL